MLRILFICAAGVLVAIGIARADDPPGRPLPTGQQFLQSRMFEDASTIAQLLDELAKVKAEKAALEAQIAKRKADDKPKD